MTTDVSLLCSNGVLVPCDSSLYTTIADAVEGMDQANVVVRVPYHSELVELVVGQQDSNEAVLALERVGTEHIDKILEILHFLQAKPQRIGVWVRCLPSRWWEVLDNYILHMLYTTEHFFQPEGERTYGVPWQLEQVLIDTLRITGDNASPTNYHQGMLRKWWESNPGTYCKKHESALITECDSPGTCYAASHYIVNYMRTLVPSYVAIGRKMAREPEYAGLNILTHNYEDWEAVGKVDDLKYLLDRTLDSEGTIQEDVAFALLTRVVNITIKEQNADHVAEPHKWKLFYIGYDARTASRHRSLWYRLPLAVLFDHTIDGTYQVLAEAGLLKYESNDGYRTAARQQSPSIRGYIGPLADYFFSLTEPDALNRHSKILKARYDGHPAVLAAEEVIPSKAMDLLFYDAYMGL